jgi:choline kinase
MKALILGAGKEQSDSGSPLPRSLTSDPYGKRALDWIISAFASSGVQKTIFIGGYRIEEIGNEYPQLDFLYNPRWEHAGVLSSMHLAADELDEDLFMTHADIVFSEQTCERLKKEADDMIAIAIDSTAPTDTENIQKNRVLLENGYVKEIGFFPKSSTTDGEFIGLAYLGKKALQKIRSFLNETYKELIGQPFEQSKDVKNAYITDLFRYLIRSGLQIKAVDIGSHWAEIDHTSKFAKFVLGTKSDTLARLKNIIKKAHFCEQISFTVGEWKNAPEDILQNIKNTFTQGSIVCRSSALMEDSWSDSFAGAFESILGVPAEDKNAVRDAIEKVASSYLKAKGGSSADNQILVQEQIENVASSGVVFTRDIESGAPYYVINYDDETKKTDSITSGSGKISKTCILYKNAKQFNATHPFYSLIEAIREIETATGCYALDIEFVITTEGAVFILQTRPIAKASDQDRFYHSDLTDEVDQCKSFFQQMNTPKTNLYGNSTIFADMPDWNPAEMIGSHPSPLAASLYHCLITASTWQSARAELGYHTPGPTPLMYLIAGHPYIDVRKSFNNLIPEKLHEKTAEKLINYYLDELRRDPSKHDKVEFEICFTCYDFTIKDKLKKLSFHGFETSEIIEIEESLHQLTDNIISNSQDLFNKLKNQFSQLDDETRRIAKEIELANNKIELIQSLILLCINKGTYPFAIAARCGFIAHSMLRSLAEKGVLDEDRTFYFFHSIDNVATDIVQSFGLLQSGDLSINEFLRKYGHLRQGTYDINSPRYDEQKEWLSELSNYNKSFFKQTDKHEFCFSDAEVQEMTRAIENNSFSFTLDDLLSFSKEATYLREYGKLLFTKTLSEILRLIESLGKDLEIPKNKMSYLEIDDVIRWSWNSPNLSMKDDFLHKINHNLAKNKRSSAIKLPHIITREADFDFFELPETRPNFVTSKSVIAPICFLDSHVEKPDLSGKIVLIESADPGYDWIFIEGIAGLITLYGGAASHMTIRASEFNLPAAIGCGEKLFQILKKAQRLELNCQNKTVHPIL